MQPLKEPSSRGWPIERARIGDFDLTESEVVDDARAEVRPAERRWETPLPAPERALHRAGPQAVADALECLRVFTRRAVPRVDLAYEWPSAN